MNLDDLRKKIDGVNEEIIALFARRLALTKQVAQVKKQEHLPVDDFAREAQQKERLRSLSLKYGINPSVIEEIFSTFVVYSKMQMQRDMM